MSMGQLYHYISSKDDILYLMHRRDQEMWYQHLVDSGIDEIEDPVAKMEHALRINIEYLSRHRDFVQFIFNREQEPRSRAPRPGARDDDQNVVGFYRHLLAGLPDLKYRDRAAELAANVVHYMCIFLALRGRNLDLGNRANFDEAVDFLVDFIFHGLEIQRAAQK